MDVVRGVRCVKCLGQTPAETSVGFGFGGGRYVLDLCDRHGREATSQLRMWMRVAREDGTSADSAMGRQTLRSRDEWQLSDVTPVLTSKVVPPKPQPQPQPIVDVPVARSEVAGVPVVSVPRNAHDLYFTPHARNRMLQREVTLWQAMWAVEAPDRVRPGTNPEYPSSVVHHRANIKVVVLPDRRVVLTVANENETGED